MPFALTTCTGARVTLSVRFQPSNVQTAISLEDLRERGIQPIFKQDDGSLEFLGGH